MTELPVCSSRASDQPAAAARAPDLGVFFRGWWTGGACSLAWMAITVTSDAKFNSSRFKITFSHA